MNTCYPISIRLLWGSLLTPLVLFLMLSSARAEISVLEITNGMVTMEATGVSLKEVAKAISEKAQIEVTASPGIDRVTDISLYNQPFLTAIARISPNHLIVQRRIHGINAVKGVHFILDSGQSGGGEFNLPTGAPADEIAQEERLESQVDDQATGDSTHATDDQTPTQ